MGFRPFEGFVFTVCPFSFSSIVSNLNMDPVMMGKSTVWKPAITLLLSNYFFMKIFQEADLSDNVHQEPMIKPAANLTLSAGLARAL